MVDNDLAFMPATELLALIREKQVSPVELTQLYFDRIERLDSQLNSYLTLDYAGAKERANAAERELADGNDLGLLHGLPISVKDLEATKALRTTRGSLAYEDLVPEHDSVVVERVRKAGAVILGKTNTPEFGMLGTTENRLGDACRNPWNTERTPGGSSGGAGAALAAGLCPLATGSDGGGSIRIPASFSGVYGIKPTQGRVPRYSGPGTETVGHPVGQSGPMSHTVADSALLLEVLSGHDPRDPTSLRQPPLAVSSALDQGANGLRIGWTPDFGYAPVDPEVVSITSSAAQVFAELGARVDESDLALDDPGPDFVTIFSTGAYTGVEPVIEEGKADLLTDYAERMVEGAQQATGADYARAIGTMYEVRQRFDSQFERFDLLLSPTMAVPAFPIGQRPSVIDGREVDEFLGFLPFTFPINMIGYPAASIPCGFSADGMPIGLHIIGRFGDEATIIAASAAFEAARPWADRRPPVS